MSLMRLTTCIMVTVTAGVLAGCGQDGGSGDTIVSAPVEFTVVVGGDIAQCFDRPASESVAAGTAALVSADDALVLTVGDNVYVDGTPEEFDNCFDPTWGKFKNRIRPTLGNHEIHTSNADGYFGYFGEQAGPARRAYYSFDHGGWHFISLNSMDDTSEGSPQYQWLIADLAKSRHMLCTVAYWHYPLFNSGEEHGVYPQMKPFFDALHKAGVEIVLSGDEHVYERFAPQTADGVADPARGVRQFVVGTGGAELYKFGPPLPNSEARIEGTWGILRLTLGAGKYSWQFLPVGGGAALDVGTDTCHR